jgi:uncharacterized protein (UPF0276 family)
MLQRSYVLENIIKHVIYNKRKENEKNPLNKILSRAGVAIVLSVLRFMASDYPFGIERTDNAKTKRKRTNNNLPTLHTKP